MGEAQPVIHVSTPALLGSVLAILATLVALAAVFPPAAILFVIFGFLFGHRLLRYVTTELETEPARADADRGADATTADDPLEVLRDRYARGELSDAEFKRKLDALLETETTDGVETFLERERDAGGADRDAATEGVELDRELERS